jgi:hypothetical protein
MSYNEATAVTDPSSASSRVTLKLSAKLLRQASPFGSQMKSLLASHFL